MGRSGYPSWRFWAGCAAVPAGAWLLVLAFPPYEKAGLAWLALVPLLLVALRASPGWAFRAGFGAGWIFWLGTLRWLLKLGDTSPVPLFLYVLAWVALSACLAAYWGGFAWTVRRLAGLVNRERFWASPLLTLLIPLVWVGWEYLRATLFSGFPWNPLGGSQYRQLAVIQIAEYGGVYAVSALVVLLNAGLALTIDRYLNRGPDRRYRPHIELFIALAVVLFCVFQIGPRLIRRQTSRQAQFRVAVIQPAVPQLKKWEPEDETLILDRLERLTRQMLPLKPDLIVWPETAMPTGLQSWTYDTNATPAWQRVGRLLTADSAILIGTMAYEGAWPRPDLYNAAVLVNASEGVLAAYAKQHLVPFGEYIPLERWFPKLGEWSPLGWSCTPGRRAVVFELDGGRAFSAMICFEDVFPNLVRTFVRNGARLLINMTNDAWFDGTAAAVQHLSHSVLRAVENRVPVIRAANSGVSCFIDRSGRIYARIAAGPQGQPQETALLSGVEFPPADQPLTLYARWGDWLLARPCGWAVGGATLLALIVRLRKGKNKSVDNTNGGKNPDALTAPVATPPDSRNGIQDD